MVGSGSRAARTPTLRSTNLIYVIRSATSQATSPTAQLSPRPAPCPATTQTATQSYLPGGHCKLPPPHHRLQQELLSRRTWVDLTLDTRLRRQAVVRASRLVATRIAHDASSRGSTYPTTTSPAASFRTPAMEAMRFAMCSAIYLIYRN